MKTLALLLALCLPACAAVRDSTTAQGTSAVRSVAVPLGSATNDVTILACSCDGAANTNGALPAGFTAFFNDSSVTTDGQVTSAGWKRLTGADSGSYSFTGTPSNAPWECQAIALSGRHTTNPPVAGTTAVQNTGQSSPVSLNANGVTAVAGDDLLWLGALDNTVSAAVTGYTAPGGYTEQEDQSTTFASLSLATNLNVGAGATGTISGSGALSSGLAGWLSVLIRIPSAAGGGPAPCQSLALLGVGC